VFIQPSGQDRLQQRSRVPAFQGGEVELRQARERLAKLPRREHERDLFRYETTRHKGQGPHGRTVEPLRVVNGTREWLLLGGFGQQAKDRQTDQESIRRGSRPKSERDAKCVVLRLRQTVRKLEERGTQLLDRSERKLHLRFDPGRPGGPKLARRFDRVLEQRGLADARFAMHHQYAAAPAARAVQEPVEHLAFTFPAEQLPS